MTQEHRKKISASRKGYVMSQAQKEKIGLANKNKVRTIEHRKKYSEAKKGHFVSVEARKKMSLAQKDKPKSEESVKKMSLALMGRTLSPEHKKKIGLAHKGEKSHYWRGGITPIHTLLRNSLEYKLWRESVFKRDNFTCIWCGQRGIKLNADHIKPFALYPELRFAIDNGRTLCVNCHRKTDTFAGKTSPIKK